MKQKKETHAQMVNRIVAQSISDALRNHVRTSLQHTALKTESGLIRFVESEWEPRIELLKEDGTRDESVPEFTFNVVAKVRI